MNDDEYLMKAYEVLEKFNFCKRDFIQWLEKWWNCFEDLSELGLYDSVKELHSIILGAYYLFYRGKY